MQISGPALLLVATALLARPHGPHAMGWTAYDTGQLDAACVRWVGDGGSRRAPALSVAVGLNGRLIFARGYGEARPGVPASERTVYHIGSLTKQFTAAAMLSLIDRNVRTPRSHHLLTVGSAVSDVLEGFDNWENSASSKATVRGLLTMTSGVPNLVERPPPEVDPWSKVSADRLLNALRERPANNGAGIFSYNNSSYFLLAEMIEALSGATATGATSFSDFVRAAVIVPAKLNDTAFVIGDRDYDATRVAVPSWGNTPPHRRRPAFVDAEWLKGAADMASSATDLFAWDKALMEGKVVSPASRLLMFSDAARVGPSRYYGMGWFVEHEQGWDWYSHAGYVPGFTSLNSIVRNPLDGSWVSVSLLTNADDVRGLDELSASIFQSVKQRSSPKLAADDWAGER